MFLGYCFGNENFWSLRQERNGQKSNENDPMVAEKTEKLLRYECVRHPLSSPKKGATIIDNSLSLPFGKTIPYIGYLKLFGQQ